MAEIEVFPPAKAPTPSANVSTEPVEEVWIHWKDPYWKQFDSKTPQPDPTTTSLSSVENGTRDSVLTANHELTIHFVPFLVVLAVVLLLTIVGNVLVCIVYRTRFRRNTDNFFVVFLAVLESVFIFLGVPLEMSVMSLPLLFDVSLVCKVIRFVQTASVCVVLLTLTAIALDRYWKLTHPTNFLSSLWAKRLCFGAVLLGVCVAVPSPMVFGSKTTNVTGVVGVTCGVDDATRSGSAGIVYIVLLLLTYSFTLLVNAVLYGIMLVRICRRKSAARGERVSPTRRKFPQTHRFGVTEDSTSSYGGDDTRPLPTSSSHTSFGTAGTSTPKSGRMSPNFDSARVPLKSGVTGKESTRIGQRTTSTLDVQSTQMTRIFFGVTVWTVIAITPFIVFRTLQVLTDSLEDIQPVIATVMYQVGAHLYLLHPPVIPGIYLLCNHVFRREVRRLLRKYGLSCKRPSHTRENSNS